MMVEKVIEEVKPDVMVCDQLLTVPSVEKSMYSMGSGLQL